jgi:hypothetical protein
VNKPGVSDEIRCLLNCHIVEAYTIAHIACTKLSVVFEHVQAVFVARKVRSKHAVELLRGGFRHRVDEHEIDTKALASFHRPTFIILDGQAAHDTVASKHLQQKVSEMGPGAHQSGAQAFCVPLGNTVMVVECWPAKFY